MSYPINYDPEGLAKGHLANAQQQLEKGMYHAALVEMAKATAPLKHLREGERAKAQAFKARFKPRYKKRVSADGWQQVRHLVDNKDPFFVCDTPVHDSYDKPYRIKSIHCEACLMEAHRRFKEKQ